MERQYWIDGFNFFHRWERTRDLFGRGAGLDMTQTIDRSLRMLARELAGRVRHTIVFMDGGWQWEEKRLGHLRIRYAGPGEKADDRMVSDLRELDGRSGCVTAVTDDRELGGRLALLGGRTLGVRECLALFEKKKPARSDAGGKPRGDDAETMRMKCRTLSPADVQAWLEYFGWEDDGRQ